MATKTFHTKNEIHITSKPGKAATDKAPAVAPVVDVIPGNSDFEADDTSDVIKDLKRQGVIVEVQPEKTETKKVSTKKAPAPKKAAASEEPKGGTDEDVL